MRTTDRQYDSMLFIHYLSGLTIRGFQRYYENIHVLRRGNCWLELSPLVHRSRTAVNVVWMYVPPEYRGAGHAAWVLNDLTKVADNVNIDLIACARPFDLKHGLNAFLAEGMPPYDITYLDDSDFELWQEVICRYGFLPDPQIPISRESMLVGRWGLHRYPKNFFDEGKIEG